jgi:hypothetical protein
MQDWGGRVEEAPKDTSWERGEWYHPVLCEFRILIESHFVEQDIDVGDLIYSLNGSPVSHGPTRLQFP